MIKKSSRYIALLFRIIAVSLFIQSCFLFMPHMKHHYLYFLTNYDMDFVVQGYKTIGVDIYKSSNLPERETKYNALSIAAANGDFPLYEKLKNLGFNEHENLGNNTTPFSIKIALMILKGQHSKSDIFSKISNLSVVKEVKYLQLEGADLDYKNATNPSIIKLSQGYLLAARVDSIYQGKLLSNIVFTKLDNKLNQLSKTEVISKKLQNCQEYCTAQDPRLFLLHNKIYMLYNAETPVNGQIISTKRSMHLAEIEDRSGSFKVKKSYPLHYNAQKAVEKNWSPLVLDDELYLVYSISPQLNVLKVNLNNGICSLFSSLENSYISHFGNIHGGTNYVQIAEKRFLSIAHSHASIINFYGDKWVIDRFYFPIPNAIEKTDQGFIIENIPPHPLFSSLPPKLTFNSIKSTMFVHFPGGLIDLGEYFLVSAGIHDNQIVLYKLDKHKLINIMSTINALA